MHSSDPGPLPGINYSMHAKKFFKKNFLKRCLKLVRWEKSQGKSTERCCRGLALTQLPIYIYIYIFRFCIFRLDHKFYARRPSWHSPPHFLGLRSAVREHWLVQPCGSWGQSSDGGSNPDHPPGYENVLTILLFIDKLKAHFQNNPFERFHSNGGEHLCDNIIRLTFPTTSTL